jgi:hypothetical protein
MMTLSYFLRSARIYALVSVLLYLSTIANEAEAQSIRIVPPNFDTIAVGRTTVQSCSVINLTNQPINLIGIRLSSSANQSAFSVTTQLGFPIAAHDTIYIPIRCFPTLEGLWTDTIYVQTQTLIPPFTSIQVSTPITAVSRSPRSNEVFIRPGLRVIPECAAPGDTVRLELYLAEGNTQSLLRASQPFFRSTISFNANILSPLSTITMRGTPSSRRYYLDSRWDGRSPVLYTIPLLVMNGDTDRTGIEIFEFIWGDGTRSDVFVDPPRNISFCVNICTEGGKRLFRVAGVKNVLLASVAPNPTSDNIEIRYTLNAPDTPIFSLLDTQGRVVQDITPGNQTKGDYTLTLDTRSVASGMYRLLMRTALGVEQRTVAIIR